MFNKLTATIAVVVFAAAFSSANAAVISYAGYQDNVDPKETTTPQTVANSYGWRNARQAIGH